MSPSKPYIGGQAVIEGVMMRAPACVSVAVRRPDGTIAVRETPLRSRFASSPMWKLPGIRGMVMLVESLSLGYSALRFSAEQQMSDEEREKSQSSSSAAMVVATLVALGLFIGLPQLLAAGASSIFGASLDVQDTAFHVLIGGFKLLVLVGYLGLISRIPEVRRVFQYHGAEHKTIYAYELGLPLSVESVRAQPKLHPRCGTTFLVVVVLVSIVVGAIATPVLLPNARGWLGQLLTLGLRIALLPVIAALSYEFQRFSARYCTSGPLRVLLWPGYLCQLITVREPDDSQIEIALAAMQAARVRETASGAAGEGAAAPLLFTSFQDFLDASSGRLPEPSEPIAAE